MECDIRRSFTAPVQCHLVAAGKLAGRLAITGGDAPSEREGGHEVREGPVNLRTASQAFHSPREVVREVPFGDDVGG